MEYNFRGLSDRYPVICDLEWFLAGACTLYDPWNECKSLMISEGVIDNSHRYIIDILESSGDFSNVEMKVRDTVRRAFKAMSEEEFSVITKEVEIRKQIFGYRVDGYVENERELEFISDHSKLKIRRILMFHFKRQQKERAFWGSIEGDENEITEDVQVNPNLTDIDKVRLLHASGAHTELVKFAGSEYKMAKLLIRFGFTEKDISTWSAYFGKMRRGELKKTSEVFEATLSEFGIVFNSDE